MVVKVTTLTKKYSLLRLISISSLNFGLNYTNAVMMIFVLPALVSMLIGEDKAAFWVGVILAVGLGGSSVCAILTGFISDSMKCSWVVKFGRRAPLYVSGTLLFAAGALIIAFLSFLIEHEDTTTTNEDINTTSTFTSSTTNNLLLIMLGGVEIISLTTLGVVNAASQALIPDLVDASQYGKASGVFGFASYLGAFCCLLVTPVILMVFEYFIVCIVMFLLILICLMITFCFNREKIRFKNDDEYNEGDVELLFGDVDTKIDVSDTSSNKDDTDGGMENSIQNNEDFTHEIEDSKWKKLIAMIKGVFLRVYNVFVLWKNSGFIWVCFIRMIFNFSISMVQNFAYFTVLSIAQLSEDGSTSYSLIPFSDFLMINDPNIATALMVAVIMIFSLLFSIPAGMLADHFGVKLIVIVCSIACSVSLTLLGLGIFFRINFGVFTCICGFFGSVMGSYFAVDQALIIKAVPSSDRFGFDIAIATSLTSVPQSLAPFFGGVVISFFLNFVHFSDNASYSLLYLLSAGIMFLSSLLLFFLPKSLNSVPSSKSPNNTDYQPVINNDVSIDDDDLR